MKRLPKPGLTAAEWKLIAPVLPRSPPNRRKIPDRQMVAALLMSPAVNCSLQQVARASGIPEATLASRYRRWRETGVMDRLIKAGEPAMMRLGKLYQRLWTGEVVAPTRPEDAYGANWNK